MSWSRKKEHHLLESYESINSIDTDRVRQKFWASRAARISVYLIGFLVFIGIFADFLANEKPIYCSYQGKAYWPIFQEYMVASGLAGWDDSIKYLDWHNTEFESAIRPLIPYSSRFIDNKNAGFRKPFGQQNLKSERYRHWLGTDQIGRDIAAGLIHGTRISLAVGILSMLIASMIGIGLGMIAGYYGDHDYQLSWATLIITLIVGAYILFLVVSGFSLPQLMVVSLVVILLGYLVLQIVNRFLKRTSKISIPLDIIIMRVIEIINSFPALFTILAIVAIVQQPSIIVLIVIIGLIRWTGIARFTRAEMLKVRSAGYIQAAKGLGVSDWNILRKSALPNVLPSILITIAFGIAGAILLESFLSFLGIGIDPSQVSWGSLLQTARQNFENWWLALFPGMAIFISVTAFNLIGDRLTHAMKP